jgi:tetratricopeptide (TPR) repeat protein
MMPAVWILGAMCAWLRPGRRAQAGAYVLFAGALLSKEQAVVLPLLFALADVTGMAPDAPGRSVRRWVLRYLPLMPIVGAYFVLRHALFGGTEYVFAGWSGLPLSILYAIQSVFAPFYGLRYEPDLTVWWSPMRLGLAVAALAAIVFYARRDAEAPFDERYVFLASLGAVAIAARALPEGRVWAAAASAVVLLAAAVSTQRAQYFRDDLAFSRQWLATNPRSVNAEYNFGFSLARAGDYAGAVGHYEKALQLRPDYAFAHNNLANALVALGRSPEAIPHFRQAVRLDPGYFDAHFNMGLALCQGGDLEGGIGALAEASALRPHSAGPHINLGNAYAARGDVQKAASEFERALTLAPESPEAHSNYAALLAGAGRLDEAIGHFREALRLNPELEDARRNLEAVLAARAK